MKETTTFPTWLWNPFRKIAGGPALIIGVIILILTGFLASPTRTHFDGVLDTHLGFAAPLWVFLTEGIVNWLSLAGALWVAGAILRGPTSFRALDLFGTQALARWPFLLTTFVCFLPPLQTITDKMNKAVQSGELIPKASAMEWLVFSFVSLVMILVTIWFVALSWKSFRISCDVRGWKAIVAFIVAILVAEVISKVTLLKGIFPLIS